MICRLCVGLVIGDYIWLIKVEGLDRKITIGNVKEMEEKCIECGHKLYLDDFMGNALVYYHDNSFLTYSKKCRNKVQGPTKKEICGCTNPNWEKKRPA